MPQNYITWEGVGVGLGEGQDTFSIVNPDTVTLPEFSLPGTLACGTDYTEGF